MLSFTHLLEDPRGECIKNIVMSGMLPNCYVELAVTLLEYALVSYVQYDLIELGT